MEDAGRAKAMAAWVRQIDFNLASSCDAEDYKHALLAVRDYLETTGEFGHVSRDVVVTP
jgi:hypothetical protein